MRAWGEGGWGGALRRLTNCERPRCDRWISGLAGASVRPSVRPFVRPSVRPFVRPSVRPSVRMYVRTCVRPRVGLESGPTANFLGAAAKPQE